jgi:hypothetical protein
MVLFLSLIHSLLMVPSIELIHSANLVLSGIVIHSCNVMLLHAYGSFKSRGALTHGDSLSDNDAFY